MYACKMINIIPAAAGKKMQISVTHGRSETDTEGKSKYSLFPFVPGMSEISRNCKAEYWAG